MKILFGAVVDTRYAARGENEGQRFVQAVVVIVDGEEARHIVIVYKVTRSSFQVKLVPSVLITDQCLRS